jgi:hypothetical protein
MAGEDGNISLDAVPFLDSVRDSYVVVLGCNLDDCDYFFEDGLFN